MYCLKIYLVSPPFWAFFLLLTIRANIFSIRGTIRFYDCYWRWFSLLSSVAFMLWDNHWLAMPGEVTERWNFQSMMASNTIGYIRYVVKRNVFKHSFFEAYSFRTHTFPHHLSVKVWAWIAKMVVWCSEPKETQRSTACSQHQKQETKMKLLLVAHCVETCKTDALFACPVSKTTWHWESIASV